MLPLTFEGGAGGRRGRRGSGDRDQRRRARFLAGTQRCAARLEKLSAHSSLALPCIFRPFFPHSFSLRRALLSLHFLPPFALVFVLETVSTPRSLCRDQSHSYPFLSLITHDALCTGRSPDSNQQTAGPDPRQPQLVSHQGSFHTARPLPFLHHTFAVKNRRVRPCAIGPFVTYMPRKPCVVRQMRYGLSRERMYRL